MTGSNRFASTADQFASAVEELQGHKVAVIGHIRPDGDCIGSVTGCVAMLSQRGIDATGMIGQTDPFSPDFLTIPGGKDVACRKELPSDVTAIVTVDCGSIDRTGTLQEGIERLKSAGHPVVNIDHHDSNTSFGTRNLVEPSRESVTMILYGYAVAGGFDLTKELAHSLYAGLLTDTGSFRWGGPDAHAMAAELMGYGIDTQQITFDLIDHTTVEELTFTGEMLSRVQLLDVGGKKLALIVGDFESIDGRSKASIESLIDYVRAIEDADIGCVMKEQYPGYWSVSLRSRFSMFRVSPELWAEAGTLLLRGTPLPAMPVTLSVRFRMRLAVSSPRSFVRVAANLP